MNIIPYIGPILGASFAVLITLSSNLALPFYDEMLPLLFKVMGVFMVMQLLDNFILQPNIFSKSVLQSYSFFISQIFPEDFSLDADAID